ncbi:iron dicitrate transporter FecR [Bacteroidia bacterium]|nr:iron dicitrate transporter FecR [Bacteroidia bacterium]
MSKHLDLLNKYNEGKATDEEKRQLLRLLNYDELWSEALDDIWNHSFGTMCEETDQRILNFINEATKPRYTLPWREFMRIAVCIAIISSSMIALHFWKENQYLTKYEDMIIEVDKGQKSDVILPDGTKVFLNSDSQLKYGKDFNGKVRKVSLVGEAFFEVFKDSSSPFMVEVGGLEIQAFGTSFNIKAYPDEDVISTYLKTGIIEVKSDKENIRLVTGESVVFKLSKGEMYKEGKVNNRFYLAWLADEMFFENILFTDLLKELERHYNVHFIIESENLNTISFNGTLRNSSLQSTLDALAITSGIRYQTTPNGIELYSY